MKVEEAPYALTHMQNGEYRAECYVDPCFWWTETVTPETGLMLLSHHMRRHHITMKSRLAVSEG